MRWDNLQIETDEEARLPGYRDVVPVRRFDAPEALSTRFYEVQAKSALNKVPEQSRMPFRWTVNPYRGCSHACSYCICPTTPVLMADGTHRPIGELRKGDEIYGTEVVGRYRRYVRTTVLDQWSTVKPAYRVTLEDGTKLVASADHRFLGKRGWKHVTGSEQGSDRRPHLTVGGELLGTGRFERTPVLDADYRRGYLCGMVRGDGHIGTYEYDRAGRSHGTVHRFRLALCDDEALRRTEDYLLREGVATTSFAFAAGSETRRPARAIRTSAKGAVERIRELVRWPWAPSDSWHRGFLAGIFDAEGSRSRGVLRISNTDELLVDRIEWSLCAFGFRTVRERRADGRDSAIRVRGGLPEALRFFHLTDPAITRKRDLAGTALKSPAPTRIVSIELLPGARRLCDITTGTGDFIADGVVSHNCFARPTHRYLGFDAGRDFEREVVVKVNVPEVLRAELAKPKWGREHVAFGTNTDPYQWVEGRYGLMRGIWEAMRDSRNPCSVLTKSPLLLRDLDLMQAVAAVTSISANLSVPTIDPAMWRATEPHTPHPRARLEAVAELNRAGIPCGVLVAPLMTGINDDPDQVAEILEAAAEAGAVGISGIPLYLRGEVRDVFFAFLRDHRPDLVDAYDELYARGAYVPEAERRRLMALLDTPLVESGWRDRARARGTLPVVEGGIPGVGEARTPESGASLPPLVRQEALF